jgi:hypothetical protein
MKYLFAFIVNTLTMPLEDLSEEEIAIIKQHRAKTKKILNVVHAPKRIEMLVQNTSKSTNNTVSVVKVIPKRQPVSTPEDITHGPIGKCDVILVVEPPQSGKTTIAGEYILKCLDVYKAGPYKPLFIWIGPCNLMLNTQTCLRMKNLGLDSYTLASKSDGSSTNFKTVEEVIRNIDRIGVLSVCAHYIRWNNIEEIVKQLPIVKRIATFIIDEVDVTATTPCSRTAIDLIKASEWCRSIYTMTATPTDNQLEKIGPSELIWTREIHDKYLLLDNYEHFDINDIENVNMEKQKTNNEKYEFSAVTYAANAIDYIKMSLGIEGSIWFLPSHTKQASHEEMRDMALDKGFKISVLINGKDKEARIYRQNGECIVKNIMKWSGKKPLSCILDDLRKENPGMSMFITGNICESRGITIMSEDFIFDYAVFSDGCAGTPEAVYQLFGRCLGPFANCGKVPKIIAPSSMHTVAMEYEALVLKMKQNSRDGPTVDASYLRKLRNQVNQEFSISGVHDFKTWLKQIYRYHGRPLADSTIKNYYRTAMKYMSNRVNSKFPDSLIQEWESVTDDKHHTSNSMKRYNEYVDWKQSSTLA